jgi:hypothetical protein
LVCLAVNHWSSGTVVCDKADASYQRQNTSTMLCNVKRYNWCDIIVRKLQRRITESEKVKRQSHCTCGKLENSSVLSERVKDCNDGVEVTEDVRKPFQASAAAAGKTRPPIVGRQFDGVLSLFVAADVKCRRDSKSATLVNSQATWSKTVQTAVCEHSKLVCNPLTGSQPV